MNARKIPGVDDPADPDEIEDELEQQEEEGDVVVAGKESDMPTDKEKADKLAKDTQEQAQLQARRQEQRQGQGQVTPHKIDPETRTDSINEPAGSDVTPEPSTEGPPPEDPSRARAPVGQTAPPEDPALRRHDDKDDKEDERDDKNKGKSRK